MVIAGSWVFPCFPLHSNNYGDRCLRCLLSHQSSRILTLTNQAKNKMPGLGPQWPDLLTLLAIVGFAAVIFCCGWFLIFLCSRLCFDHPDRHIVIDSVALDPHQLQVNVRPYDIPIGDSIALSAPSAPRLDLEDLPPSYEEAVKMTISTQV